MGHVGAVNRSVYCLTKHALEGLTKAMALELAPHGICVVSIAPTFIESRYWHRLSIGFLISASRFRPGWEFQRRAAPCHRDLIDSERHNVT